MAEDVQRTLTGPNQTKNSGSSSDASYYLRQKKTDNDVEIVKIVNVFKKSLDNSNFDAQGRAKSRKIGLGTLRLAIFEQY